MTARMPNPAAVLGPEVLPSLLKVVGAVKETGVPDTTLQLVYLRASQINGSSWNVNQHSTALKAAGESTERIFNVAAWRETPFYTPEERAALALAEAATRLSDTVDPVSDELWAEASKHYDEKQLAALLVATGISNFWHRIMPTTRQPAELPAQG
ncbi:carboxymuconolactone decarboxylase family protein [Streptomyces luteolus]|uniref:Carboxymuconolactone decarboxylase family protein n=1 Tax=Streptomyces luteolus TaxID=3043615 RepID=A0ABT6T3Y8_9ACTN|nr:carboxymuconolactone decarboxylase family protein [Streptomyces sp. B-S-A12]MDI3422583.1 carboxymuconolactone decarboxylase family protein [Streptomyces sp. B-S-A12]